MGKKVFFIYAFKKFGADQNQCVRTSVRPPLYGVQGIYYQVFGNTW